MRVISGKYKGLELKGFELDGTRATMARVRESLLAMLDPFIDESICLDLFAGTGSLGIESLSNGASKVYFNDINPKAVRIIKDNLQTLKINNLNVTNYDFFKALKYYQENNFIFDIIFLDPPYDMKVIEKIFSQIDNITKAGSVIVCEIAKNYHPVIDTPYTLIKDRNYGDKKILIYEKR